MGDGGGESLEDLLLWESTLSFTQNPSSLCFLASQGDRARDNMPPLQ